MALRVLILYANPVAVSFGATLHRQVVTTLRSREHQIDDCDLYAESFDPVMGEQERIRTMTPRSTERRSRPMRTGCWRRKRWSSSIRFGTRDFRDPERLLRPRLHSGVSFTIGPDGAPVRKLQKLRKLAAVCTYGAIARLLFAWRSAQRVVKRLVRSMPGHAVRCDYLAYYDMDHSTAEKRTAFLEKVKRAFEAW